MYHLIKIKPSKIQTTQRTTIKRPTTIKDQELWEDVIQLANLYNMAFPDVHLRVEINSIVSLINAALSFLYAINEECFPLTRVWEWLSELDDYNATVKRWLYNIPLTAMGLDWDISPKRLNEPMALLVRLESVSSSRTHKQVLMFEYREWEWDGLLDTFKLNRVIPVLEDEDLILPPPFDKLPALVKYVTRETDTYFLDYARLTELREDRKRDDSRRLAISLPVEFRKL